MPFRRPEQVPAIQQRQDGAGHGTTRNVSHDFGATYYFVCPQQKRSLGRMETYFCTATQPSKEWSQPKDRGCTTRGERWAS